VAKDWEKFPRHRTAKSFSTRRLPPIEETARRGRDTSVLAHETRRADRPEDWPLALRLRPTPPGEPPPTATTSSASKTTSSSASRPAFCVSSPASSAQPSSVRPDPTATPTFTRRRCSPKPPAQGPPRHHDRRTAQRCRRLYRVHRLRQLADAMPQLSPQASSPARPPSQCQRSLTHYISHAETKKFQPPTPTSTCSTAEEELARRCVTKRNATNPVRACTRLLDRVPKKPKHNNGLLHVMSWIDLKAKASKRREARSQCPADILPKIHPPLRRCRSDRREDTLYLRPDRSHSRQLARFLITSVRRRPIL